MTIPLTAGWNLISYPYLTQHEAMSLLNNLVSSNMMVKLMNESGQAIELLPIIGWVNEIQNLIPGEGYALKVTQNTNLSYPQETANADNLVNLKKIQPKNKSTLNKKETAPDSRYFQKVWSGNGYKHFNLYILPDEYLNTMLSTGDEIAVYDGQNCVGVHTVGEGESYYSLICSMKDNNETVNGFTENNPFSLRIYKDQTNYDTIEFQIMNGENNFSAGGTSLVKITNMLSNNELMVPKTTEIKTVYPNPFNPETTIQYSLHKADQVEIEIYNIKGQKVKTLVSEKQNAGNYQVTWKGKDSNGKSASSGMYFCRMKTSSKVQTRKMMLVK